jgi:hypothetical protein
LGGYGESSRYADYTIWGVGAQTAWYVSGRFDRGFMIGIDGHLQRVSESEEGEPLFFSLGDGAAVGPFVGYKRAFRTGLTLEAQLGLQATTGEADDSTILHLGLSAGWSFWRAGRPATSADASVGNAESEPAEPVDPLHRHDGLMVQGFLGGGVIVPDSCDGCGTGPGIAAGGAIGWFVHPRVALQYDGSATVGIVDSLFSSAGFVLQSFAVQYWPRGDIWLKGGVGVARLLVATPVGSGEVTGGGGTLAIGYEFHHDGNFAMDAHLRATHGSFDGEAGESVGIDSFSGGIGIAWY